jgi:AraC family transcriptional regulator
LDYSSDSERLFFLTSGGAPYDVRWKAVTSEPFEAMHVFVELPILQHAWEEIFGVYAEEARLRDISAFTDDALNSFMERLRDELMREQASPLSFGDGASDRDSSRP